MYIETKLDVFVLILTNRSTDSPSKSSPVKPLAKLRPPVLQILVELVFLKLLQVVFYDRVVILKLELGQPGWGLDLCHLGLLLLLLYWLHFLDVHDLGDNGSLWSELLLTQSWVVIECQIVLCCLVMRLVLCKMVVIVVILVVRLLRVMHHAAELHRCFQRWAVLVVLVNVNRRCYDLWILLEQLDWLLGELRDELRLKSE